MSVGPLGGLASSVAGSPLAQTKGSEIERAQHDANVQQRHDAGNRKAEAAAGIGETDGEDHQSEERDADGRRLWEEQAHKPSESPDDASQEHRRLSKDTTGQTGTQLDLCG